MLACRSNLLSQIGELVRSQQCSNTFGEARCIYIAGVIATATQPEEAQYVYNTRLFVCVQVMQKIWAAL